MFKVLSERVMRRRMGKSARQWKKLKKAERRGSTDTRAKLRARVDRWMRQHVAREILQDPERRHYVRALADTPGAEA